MCVLSGENAGEIRNKKVINVRIGYNTVYCVLCDNSKYLHADIHARAKTNKTPTEIFSHTTVIARKLYVHTIILLSSLLEHLLIFYVDYKIIYGLFTQTIIISQRHVRELLTQYKVDLLGGRIFYYFRHRHTFTVHGLNNINKKE